MVQSLLCWKENESDIVQNKATPIGSQALRFFVLDIPVGSLPSSKADFLPHERFFGKATPDSGSDLNSDSLMIM